MAEQSVIDACLHELHKRGAWAIKTAPAQIGNRSYHRRGTPDIIACYKARFISIEGKDPQRRGRTAKGSASQRLEGRRIQRAGGIWLIATSRADIADALNQIDQEIDLRTTLP